MARVIFASALARHVGPPPSVAVGASVREVLDAVFAENELARGYVLDDQAALRKHMAIFVDGNQVRDRIHLSDPVGDRSEVFVIQALSGG
jgi:sulfur-carrier protein